MAENRGKKFETVVKEAFEKVEGVSIDRLHDQTTGYLGSANICDFIVYKKPYEYYIECKTIHGNTLPLGNITNRQWSGLIEKSQIDGVKAGVLVWFVDKDITMFVPIQTSQAIEKAGFKSVHYTLSAGVVHLTGKKKRVFFEYDMETFFRVMEWKGNVEVSKEDIINELQDKYRTIKGNNGNKIEGGGTR